MKPQNAQPVTNQVAAEGITLPSKKPELLKGWKKILAFFYSLSIGE